MSESLVERVADRLLQPVASHDRERAALHVLDWTGCALIGARTAIGRAVARLADRKSSPGPCVVLGSDRRPAEVAALVNGCFGNILELDDLDRRSIMHPGPVVVPAALAAAQTADASSIEFLDAVTRGYEAAILVGRSFGPRHYAYWHPTATAGVFGATAAAASVFGLSRQHLADALGHAGTLAAGLWQCRLDGADSKPLHCGHAARSGITAAEFAAAGLSGARRILEGEKGLYAAMCPDKAPEHILSASGSWKIHELTIKPWPACRHAHPAIDGALRLRSRLGGATVREVRVSTYAEAVAFCDRPKPATDHEARFSIQHMVAIALLDGELGLASSSAQARDRPDVRLLADKVSLVVDERWTAAFPGVYGATISVATDSAGMSVDVSDPWGDPENALQQADVIAKALDLVCNAGTSRSAAEHLAGATMALSRGGEFRAWCTALEAAASKD